MDYEKKYKEALEKLREFHRDYDTVSLLIDVKEELENIFPELAESEDEKIRKALIKGVESCKASGWTNFGNNVDIDVVLAWLEKQGQVKESDTPQQEEKTCKENDNSLTSEQRVEEAMRELEEKSVAYMEAHKGETADEFIARCRGEQKPAWSEKDESHCQMLQKIICDSSASASLANKLSDWLNSLKDRVQPQPNQEWSEEDEKNWQGIWDEIWANKYDAKEYEWDTYDRFLNWLKSLRPQKQWKPSEEQMDALADALSLAKNCGEGSAFDLRTLHEQLKKL